LCDVITTLEEKGLVDRRIGGPERAIRMLVNEHIDAAK